MTTASSLRSATKTVVTSMPVALSKMLSGVLKALSLFWEPGEKVLE